MAGHFRNDTPPTLSGLFLEAGPHGLFQLRSTASARLVPSSELIPSLPIGGPGLSKRATRQLSPA
eukprot:12993427-Alexandrium_andersonii.AAC.1